MVAVAVGGALRLSPAIASDFPVHDGGLFASMVSDIRAAGFRLPVETSYNGGGIPFAYPPAGLYLAATLSALGLPTLEVLRVVPAVLATAAIVAWYLLARDLLGTRLAIGATALYALIPRSYEWLVAGGGLTRALGVLVGLLAIRACLRAFRARERWSAVAAGVLVGLTVLAHLEAAVFVAATVGLLAVMELPPKRVAAMIALSATIVVAPWLGTILVTHGATPFLSAGTSRLSAYPVAILELIGLRFTGESLVPLAAVLGSVGMVLAVSSGRGWLLAWVGVIVAAIPAPMGTFAVIPWSAAGAIAFLEGLAPRIRPALRFASAAAAVGVVIAASVASRSLPGSTTQVLSQDVRSAMGWVAAELPADSVAIVVPRTGWAYDAASEWYPHLTGQVSASTVQGHEFTARWSSAVEGSEQLLACSRTDGACLEALIPRFYPEASVVFLPKGGIATSSDCCPLMRAMLRDRWTVLYDGRGASIFAIPRKAARSVAPELATLDQAEQATVPRS